MLYARIKLNVLGLSKCVEFFMNDKTSFTVLQNKSQQKLRQHEQGSKKEAIPPTAILYRILRFL